jgi:hypothetical protein
MHTDEMRQAMSTLKAFSDKDRAYHAYQARQNYLREQRSIQRHLDELKAEAEHARAEKEQARVRGTGTGSGGARREEQARDGRSKRGCGKSKRRDSPNKSGPPKKPPWPKLHA